jgi:hypothetical protein
MHGSLNRGSRVLLVELEWTGDDIGMTRPGARSEERETLACMCLTVKAFTQTIANHQVRHTESLFNPIESYMQSSPVQEA